MKKDSLLKALGSGAIVATLYYFAGHDFTIFYAGGKTELLATAAQINERCNAEGACPAVLAGWGPLGSRSDALFRGNMLYFVTAGEPNSASDQSKANQEFRLVYSFFMPDDWFEARGGVGKTLTSGWTGR
ncbi:MAG: hypothetical protein K9J74_06740 [Sulfuritalea sp.]|nr:hypothetical protein [Sulfuritalea sp.]